MSRAATHPSQSSPPLRAKQLRADDLATRITVLRVRLKHRIGELITDARPGRSGKTSEFADVLTQRERDARSEAKTLGQVGTLQRWAKELPIEPLLSDAGDLLIPGLDDVDPDDPDD